MIRNNIQCDKNMKLRSRKVIILISNYYFDNKSYKNCRPLRNSIVNPILRDYIFRVQSYDNFSAIVFPVRRRQNSTRKRAGGGRLSVVQIAAVVIVNFVYLPNVIRRAFYRPPLLLHIIDRLLRKRSVYYRILSGHRRKYAL